MSKEHTKNVFDWLKTIQASVAEQRLPDKAFVLAFAIACHFNRKTGECFPGQECLAREIGATKRTVQRMTDSLVEQGHLEIDSTRSRLRTFVYRMSKATKMSPPEPHSKATKMSPVEVIKGDISDQQRRHSWQPKATFLTNIGDTGVAQTLKEHLNEPLKEPLRTSAERSDCESEFVAWWLAYPRREAKAQARKAYAAARKKASAETLLKAAQHAARRYANTEQRYIPLPATWLNGERWLDETSARDEPANAFTLGRSI